MPTCDDVRHQSLALLHTTDRIHVQQHLPDQLVSFKTESKGKDVFLRVRRQFGRNQHITVPIGPRGVTMLFLLAIMHHVHRLVGHVSKRLLPPLSRLRIALTRSSAVPLCVAGCCCSCCTCSCWASPAHTLAPSPNCWVPLASDRSQRSLSGASRVGWKPLSMLLNDCRIHGWLCILCLPTCKHGFCTTTTPPAPN